MKPLRALFACLWGTCFLNAADAPDYPPLPDGKAPFRALYDCDMTFILSTPNPIRQNDEPFDDWMLRKIVDEAADAGADCQIFSAGARVPWWQSKKFPIKRQLAWFEKHYGKKPVGAYTDYLLKGGDMMATFVDQCRKRGQAVLGALRLNDVHHLYDAFNPDINPLRGIYISEFYVTHPQYKLGTGPGVVHMPHNWMIPEVRDHMFEMGEELLREYDLDGLELDFLRAPLFFPRDKDVKEPIPMKTRVDIMCGFISRIRKAMDDSARDGRKRWLAVRIADQALWRDIGCDPVAWRKAGVDIFNVSPSYCTSQQLDIGELRALVPDATIYVELTHTTHRWRIDIPGDYRKTNANNFRRSSREVLQATARNAYGRGADGVSFFNFVYYRLSLNPDHTGPYAEPPWDIIPKLMDKQAMLQTPPYYFYSPSELYFPHGWEKEFSTEDKEPFVFTLDTYAPPKNKTTVLRLQLVTPEEKQMREIDEWEPVDRGQWEIRLNGVALRTIPDEWGVSPFPVEFDGGLGWPAQYRSWRVPPGLLKDGKNKLSMRLVKGGPMWLRWAEIFDPAGGEK